MARMHEKTTTKTNKTTAKNAKASKKVAAPAIVGEKRVKKTGQTVAVGPAKRKRGLHSGPTALAAVDRRRQITGTDELPKRAKVRGHGNSGRGPVGLPGKI